jgi:hypothetical protein
MWAQGFARSLLVLVLAVYVPGGCSNAQKPLIPVTGKVTYKGYALQQGTVVFSPDPSKGGGGDIAVGKIQRDGTYSLMTGDAFGAAPGWYRVTVTALAGAASAQPGQRFAVPASLLPERYRDPELSQLAREIQANQANAIDLNLE